MSMILHKLFYYAEKLAGIFNVKLNTNINSPNDNK